MKFIIIRLNYLHKRYIYIIHCIIVKSIFQSVTADTIHNVGMKYIFDHCPVIAAVGPVENLPDYNNIRSSMYWLRV